MLKTIENMTKPVRRLFGIFLVFLMGFLDFVTGPDISFSIFYLVPIMISVWYSGKKDGLLIALLSSVVWLTVDIEGGFGSFLDAVAVWNTLVRFGFYLIIVFLINEVRKFQSELEHKVNDRTADLTAEISERKKAEEELKITTEKLRQLTKRIQVIREEENKIIAREIHDELGQALTAIKIDVAWLSKRYANDESMVESLFTISNTIDDTIKTVRKISTRLRPRLLDELGLLPAIEWQMKEFQSRTGINCSMVLPEDTVDLNSIASSAIFRIFQEAITNVARHAKATNLFINISVKDNGRLTLAIRDNGIGLPQNYHAKDHSLGILGMQERARTVGGKVEVKSVKEGGTEVLVKVPIKKILKNGEDK